MLNFGYTAQSSASNGYNNKSYVIKPENKHYTTYFRSFYTNTTVSKPGSVNNNHVYSYYLGNSTLIFGISCALILFFVFTLFLLAYIFNKKKNCKNNSKKGIHDNINRNTRISLDELGELVDVISTAKKVTNGDVIKVSHDGESNLASLPTSCDVRCSEAFKAEYKILLHKISEAKSAMNDVKHKINDVMSAESSRDDRVGNNSEIVTSFPLSCDVQNDDVSVVKGSSKSLNKNSTRSSVDDDPSFWIHVSEDML